MAYIYKIENQINHKVYIGKTVFTIEHRWAEHQREVKRERSEQRPLYKAIVKYGIENFTIEKLEECDINSLSERECYWISVFDSYHNGYNATLGGDGQQYADYNLIYNLYSDGCNYKQIAALTGHDKLTIKAALESHGIMTEERKRRAIERVSKRVARLDKQTGEILEILPSASEADKRYNTGKHVAEVCIGKRKSAGGYGWKYI